MALLQVATGSTAHTTYHPMSVSLDMVASVAYAEPLDLFRPGDAHTAQDNDYSVVTFKKPLCITTKVNNTKIEHVFAESVLVTGHFQEISILLGLDENGEIQSQMKTDDK